MPKHGKRYQEALKLIDTTKNYTPQEALELIQSMPKGKFDETVEISIRLGVDPRHADQQIRGAVGFEYRIHSRPLWEARASGEPSAPVGAPQRVERGPRILGRPNATTHSGLRRMPTPELYFYRTYRDSPSGRSDRKRFMWPPWAALLVRLGPVI